MTTRKYSSRAQQTTLSSSITSTDLTMTVGSGANLMGGKTPTAGQTYTVVIDPDTALEEIVDVSDYSSGNTLTIARGIDGSTGVAHSAGAVVRHMIIGRDLQEANTHIEATTGHGATGAVVGTTNTQTLTNKTLTSPTITSPTITAGAGAEFTSIIFEGATADAYETTLTVIDPTADRQIDLPNASGRVVLIDTTDTLTNKTLTSPTISGSPVITGLSSAGMSSSSAAPKDYVDSILGSATAASTSATSAAASATAAATSATSAAASATAAATSATSASNSASAASTSASSASTSQTAAATSATSAAASATAAATSATSAAASATAAAGSVSTVAASATAAATSATSAAASATAAATSATSSATSATASASSATAAATSATSAAASATDAATTYDNFDDRYLGSKSTAPTVDNDGNTLLVGAIYWNSTLNNMYVWSGSTWVQIATTSVYAAPTLGSQTIASGTTYTNIANLTINSTTIPSSKTLVVTTDKLSALAATTSAELAGVISDETGSGALVFANTPTINGPTITATGQTPVIHGILIPSTHSIFFEGTTDDAFETTFGVIDPTADRTINLPNTSGTVITTGNSSEALPSQTGNNGKYLTTNGSTASWAAAAGETFNPLLLMGA